MIEPPLTLAEMLRRHRQAAKLSQQELAERSGLSLDAISALERGLRTRPRAATLSLLARTLGLSEDDRRILALARASPNHRPASDPNDGYRLRSRTTPLVGRSREVGRACEKLRKRYPRLVTLTGPPGVGKTEVGLAVLDALRPEVQFTAAVDLARAADPNMLEAAIAQAVGAMDGGSRGLDALAAYIASSSWLVLLDNFEHLLPAAPLLSELLTRCPELRLLVTSRSPLSLRDEQELQIAPLELKHAMTMFVRRTRERVPDFELDSSNRATVRRICQTLDCLPLALELIAPWLKLMTPDELLDKLSSRLDMLVGGAVDLPARQRTMRAAADWSYQLLEEQEQALFRRLSVFSGGANLDAIQAVTRTSSSSTPLHLLARLIDKSLLTRTTADGEVRIGMMQVLREYGHALLEESGDDDDARSAHAVYYARLAAMAASELPGSRRTEWETRLEREHGNLRTTLRWAHERGDAQLGLELVGHLHRFWARHGHMREGYVWLHRFQSLGAEVTPPTAALAMRAGSTLALRLGDYAGATQHGEAGLAMYRAQGDTRGIDASLCNLAHIAWYRGDLDRALELWEDDLALLRSTHGVDGTPPGERSTVPPCGAERGVELLSQAVRIRRQMSDGAHWLALTLLLLGDLGRQTRQPDRACAWLEEALTIFGRLGATATMVTVRGRFADVARDRGDYDGAIAGYQDSLRALTGLRDRSAASTCVEGIAACAASLGQESRSAGLYGAAAGIRETFGAPPLHPHRSEHEAIIEHLRSTLGQTAFAEAWSAGASLSFDDAVTEALGKIGVRDVGIQAGTTR